MKQSINFVNLILLDMSSDSPTLGIVGDHSIDKGVRVCVIL